VPLWLLKYWKPLAGVVLLAIVLGGIYRWGYTNAAQKFQARIVQIHATNDKAVAEQVGRVREIEQARRLAQERATKRLVDEQGKSRDLYARNVALLARLRNASQGGTGPLPGAGPPVPGVGEPPGGGLLPRDIEQAVVGLAFNCARDRDNLAAQVNGLLSAF